MAIKKAKVLSKDQFTKLLKIVSKGDHAPRDEVAVLLSFYAGLRAGEIAKLRWHVNILNAEGKVGDTIHITGDVGKRAVERVIPVDPRLKAALERLRRMRPGDEYVFYALHNNQPPMVGAKDRLGRPIFIDKRTEEGDVIYDPDTGKPVKTQKMVRNPSFVPGHVTPNAVVQWFKRLYKEVGYEGCRSHSGRRTFITVRARNCNQVGGSLRDVQILAGHKRLETTAEYIEPSETQSKLVSAW